MSRETLYERINKRVDIMIREGLVDEVKHLLEKGYSKDLKPMKSIGYRHIADYLLNGISWDETILFFKRDTRRYAKRQLTWFRKDQDIKWYDPKETDRIVDSVNKFINNR